MKTNTFLFGQVLNYLPFRLAIIFALLLPAYVLSAHPQPKNSPLAEDLKQFAGTYRLLGHQNLALEISTAGTGLTLKELWSNREISFKQQAGLNFIAAEHPDFTLDFARDKSGAISQVTAFKKDIWIKLNPNSTQKKLSPAETTQAYQKIFLAFQEAVNANATDKIQTFLKNNMAETLLETINLEQLTQKVKEMHQKTGGIALDTSKPINPETGTATFKSKSQEVQFQMSFTLNPDGKICNFGLQE